MLSAWFLEITRKNEKFFKKCVFDTIIRQIPYGCFWYFDNNVSAGRKPPFRAGRKSPILAGRKSPIVIYNLRRFFTLRA